MNSFKLLKEKKNFTITGPTVQFQYNLSCICWLTQTTINRGNQAVQHVCFTIQALLLIFLVNSYNMNKQQGDFYVILEMNLFNTGTYFKINKLQFHLPIDNNYYN